MRRRVRRRSVGGDDWEACMGIRALYPEAVHCRLMCSMSTYLQDGPRVRFECIARWAALASSAASHIRTKNKCHKSRNAIVIPYVTPYLEHSSTGAQERLPCLPSLPQNK